MAALGGNVPHRLRFTFDTWTSPRFTDAQLDQIVAKLLEPHAVLLDLTFPSNTRGAILVYQLDDPTGMWRVDSVSANNRLRERHTIRMYGNEARIPHSNNVDTPNINLLKQDLAECLVDMGNSCQPTCVPVPVDCNEQPVGAGPFNSALWSNKLWY